MPKQRKSNRQYKQIVSQGVCGKEGKWLIQPLLSIFLTFKDSAVSSR